MLSGFGTGYVGNMLAGIWTDFRSPNISRVDDTQRKAATVQPVARRLPTELHSCTFLLCAATKPSPASSPDLPVCKVAIQDYIDNNGYSRIRYERSSLAWSNTLDAVA